MISQKYHRIVFSFFMALIMSCVMSLVITTFNVGIIPDLLLMWLKAWGFAFTVAFPAIFIVSPLVHKLVNLVLIDK